MLVTIQNDGQKIVETNWFLMTSEKLYLSANAGAFRLLIPKEMEGQIPEMKTGKEFIISIGSGMKQFQKPEMVEVLFDDGSDSPYCVHMSMEQIDRRPPKSDGGREFALIVYNHRLEPVIETKCKLRFVSKIPCLKPWTEE